MSRNRWKFSKSTIAIGVFGLAVGLLAGLTVLITGQQGTGRGMGVVDDWTHHHLVFSNPGTAPDALAQGRFEQWYRIVNDPRYNMQQMKRNPAQRALATAPDFATLAARLSAPIRGPEPIRPAPWRNPKQTLKRDWSMNLGGAAATQTGSFSGTTTPTTTQTVTITNTSPSNTLTLTMSGTTGTLTFSSQPSVGNTVTMGSTVYQFESTSPSTNCSSSDRCVQIGTTTTITATNLKNAIGGVCYNTCPTSGNDPDVLAETTGTTVVTVINMTSGSITFTKSGTYPALSPSGTLTQAFTNTCSSTTTGKFIINSSTSTLASNLAAAITACNSSYSAVGVSAVQNGTNTYQVDLTADIAGTPGITLGESVGNFTWTGTTLGGGLPAATVGAGIYPAKYSFYTTTYNCATDFVAYNTGLAGGSSQATIIAYNELYAGLSPGCGTTGVPAIYWQYNTAYPYVSGGGGSADGSSIVTSVVLSGDTAGSQVAFIESNSSSVASLVVLKWSASSSLVQMNSSTNNVAPTSYRTCTAPCMTRITFSGSHNDTTSSPFYDYGNDVIYVGDDNGSLHKFTGVFNGPPAEAGSPWPVSVSSGNKLTGPVYDTSTGLVFVGDTATGAPLHSVCAVTGINAVCTTAGTVTTSGTIAASGAGMTDAPIVDSNASKAYVLINTDTTTGCLSSGSSNVPCSDVFQYATTTSIASGSQTPSKAIMGRSMGAGIPLYAGAFNDGYYSGSTTPSGALYVCGGSPSGTSNQRPTLYKIAITNGTMATSSTTGPYVAATYQGPFCSPVTEVLNGSNDYLFMSITAWAANTSCPGGCIYSYIIPGTFGTGLTPSASLTAAGGTSGIVIDNTTNTTGASQVYFSTLSAQGQGCAGNGTTGSGAGGCAVQASQSALH